MQSQATADVGGIVLAHGYGLKLYVERGHLIVHDGVGRNRNTQRFNRATSKLKRVVVIGHTGFITLEALRWIRDVGATFVQIGTDSELISISAPARHHESKMRRAQALASETELGKRLVVDLIQAKLHRQAEIAARLAHLKPTVRVKDAQPIAVSDAILEWADQLDPTLPLARLRQIESSAGRNYWQVWARVPIGFHRAWEETVPGHWHVAGPRTSWVDRKRARLAQTPAHAILNYLYAILETETIIAAHAVGLDPSLGVMHTDTRYRSSLAMDLMEPVRPVADEVALDLIEEREFSRGDFFETRRGICRLGPGIALKLAASATRLQAAVAPHAEDLARGLSRSAAHPTPLTRRLNRISRAGAA